MTRPDVWKAGAPWDALEMGWGTRRELPTGTVAHPSTNAANTHGVSSIWRPGCPAHFSNISILKANFFFCVCVYLWTHTASTAVTEIAEPQDGLPGGRRWAAFCSCRGISGRWIWREVCWGMAAAVSSATENTEQGAERAEQRLGSEHWKKTCREKTLPSKSKWFTQIM